jgi:hypothetical protein
MQNQQVIKQVIVVGIRREAENVQPLKMRQKIF